MSHAEMTTVDLLEFAANELDCSCEMLGCEYPTLAIALRSRAERLRKAISLAESDRFLPDCPDGSTVKLRIQRSDDMRALNAPDAGNVKP